MARSTPSFSSFPPSFPSFPDIAPASNKQPLTSTSDATRTRTKKHAKDKSDKEQKRRRKDKKRSPGLNDFTVSDDPHTIPDDERLKAAEDQIQLEEIRSESQSLFYSDRKGDTLNIQYGGLHLGDVPKYYLVDRGRKILGLTSSWTALYRRRHGVEIGIGPKRKFPVLTDPSSRILLATPPVRKLTDPSSSTHKYEEIDGFIRLTSRRAHVGHENASYRTITFSKSGDMNSDSDSESSSSEREYSGHSSPDDSDSEVISLNSYQATLKALEEQLKLDPSSIRAWSSLLSHSLSNIPVLSKNATKARSEITLSILSRALLAHPRNASSRTLRLKYLRAGEEIWHESKLRAEWEDAVRRGDIDIWMEWFEWRTRRGNQGVYSTVEDAKRILNALNSAEDMEVGKVRVFWRVAVLFQQAGFAERATAMFQAQAELTFKLPQALHGLPLDTQLDALEEFWESEVPRLSEESAIGWAAWRTLQKPVSNPPSTSSRALLPTVKPGTLDPFTLWEIRESQADRTLHHPTRSADEIAESDPFSTVLFSDIRPLLISLTSDSSKHAFRLAWLSILGLHIPGFYSSLSSESADDRWSYTHLTTPVYLDEIFPRDSYQRNVMADSHAGVLVGQEREYASGFGPVKCWGYGVVGPLDTISADGKNACLLWRKEDVQNVDQPFIRQIFSQVRLGTQDTEWDIYALAFEAAFSIKSALKLSRTFLSTARDSIPHWAAHARLERLRGRTEDARKVYNTVLAPSSNGILHNNAELWWDWAEMEWLAGNPADALRIILRAASVNGGVAGVHILRAKRYLDKAIEEVSSIEVFQERWKNWEASIKLRALLELLTSHSSAATLAVFDAHLSTVKNSSNGPVVNESILVASLLMLFRHGLVLKNPTPPSILRERLGKAVETYPSNTLILGMFLEGEKGQGVWGRVRGILGENNIVAGGSNRDKDIARRAAEVWTAGWERGSWIREVERTRSGLTAATLNERTRGSATLWRIFIEFEIRVGELKAAKNILFRAIGECPLSKELYLLAFGPLRNVFDRHELSKFADAMAERDLRLRQGLEDILEHSQDVGGNAEETDDSSDEIEQNASELRRLRPY